MTEQYISFETAKLAKEKGFNYTVYGMYRGQDTYWTNDGTKCVCGFDEELNDWEDEVERMYKWLTPRPTQSLLQKWLREKHKLEVLVMNWVGNWNPSIYEIPKSNTIGKNLYEGKKKFQTYEDALEHGLLEALRLIQ